MAQRFPSNPQGRAADDFPSESELLIHAFWDNSPNLIFLKDRAGRYLYVNREFERALRLNRNDIRGKRDEEIFQQQQAESFRANDAKVLEARAPLEFEEVSEQEDGPHTSIVHKFPLINANGDIYAIGGIVTDITERRRTREALQHSEERFRSVVETATDAVVSVDESSKILFANPATTRVFGYSSTELVGQSLTILMPEFMRELHQAGFQRYLTTGRRHIDWQGVQLVGLRKNGGEFPIEVSFGEVVKNGRHTFTGFIRDATERKQIELLRVEQACHTALRADVSDAFETRDGLREVLQGCAEALVRHANAVFARIWTLAKDQDVLELQASAGMYTHLDGAHSRVRVGDLKIGLIAREKKPHLTNDVTNDSLISDKAWAKREGIVAFAGHPLVVENRAVGVMAMFSRTPFASGTLDTLASVADSIAQGIGRKRALEALRQSEIRFRSLVEGIQDYSIFMLNPEGRVMTWNSGAERIKGYKGFEIIGRNHSCFYEANVIANGKPQQELDLAATTGHFEDEGWCIRKDASRFWASVIITPIHDEKGNLLGFSRVTRDLTERKHFEQELQHERDRLRLLLDLNNRVVSNLDLGELFYAMSTELKRIMECELIGLALPEPDGKHLREHHLEKSQDKVALHAGELLPVEGTPTGFVFRKGKPFLLDSAELSDSDPKVRVAPGHHSYDAVVAQGFKSGCFLPLVSRNRVLGVLQLAKRGERVFDPPDVDFLSQVANQMAIAVDNALSYQQIRESKARLASEKQYLEEEIQKEYNFEEIVGDSPALAELLRNVALVAPTDTSVLILGETGTGKELIARAIHSRSSRKDRPFVKVSCGAIPAGLVESELFGHVKGAFTGATATRSGRFELADGGSLFLDEVGELPLETQVKLLRVLQEREFEPVGSDRTIHVDVRIVAATNRDLEQAVKTGQFRSDLYYRLNVVPLRVPPLRERRSDISQLVMFFLDRCCRRAGKEIKMVPPQTLELLENYSWPGNVRELQNVIERGVVLAQGATLTLGSDLLPAVRPGLSFEHTSLPNAQAGPGPKESAPEALSSHVLLSLEEAERRHIAAILERTGGVISGPKGAATLLKINPNTLRSRMRKLGISIRSHDIS
jgi:PAS domain S-box-containing protein